jgi:hypothetical protein
MCLSAGYIAEFGFRMDFGIHAFAGLPSRFLYSVPMIHPILPVQLFGSSAGAWAEGKVAP